MLLPAAFAAHDSWYASGMPRAISHHGKARIIPFHIILSPAIPHALPAGASARRLHLHCPREAGRHRRQTQAHEWDRPGERDAESMYGNAVQVAGEQFNHIRASRIDPLRHFLW